MVQRFFNLFHREFGGLHKAALLLAVSAMVSSLLGLFRDRLLAGTFGASRSLDIYYASFKLPDFLYNIVALSLVSVTVLIPFFLEKVVKSENQAKSFFNQIFTVFLLAMIILAGIFFLVAPYLSNLIAPGFSPEEQSQLVFLTKIMLLSPILLGLSNLLSGVIQSFRRFFIYALSPIFYNLSIIFGIVFLYPRMGLKGIIWGVVLGAFLHALIQLPGLVRLGFLPRLSFNINFSEIRKIIQLSLPRSLGLGLYQIVIIIITAIASLLTAGSIAVFNLAMNLQSVILTTIGVSYSVAAFPILAKLYVNNQRKEFLKQTSAAARHIIFWSLPAVFLLIVLRAQIVRVIFGTGAFDWAGTRLVAATLAIFAVSITFQALNILFTRAFYAAGKTCRPLMINICSFIFIIITSFIFVDIIKGCPEIRIVFERILRIEDVRGVAVLALPLAFSLGMILNFLLLIKFFKQDFGWQKKLSKMFTQVFFASFLIGLVSYFSLQIFDNVFDIQTFLGIFMQGLLSGLLGILAGAGFLYSIKNRELLEILDSFKQKFWETPVIASEPEKL